MSNSTHNNNSIFADDYPVPVYYDLETTGLDVEKESVLQIAACISPKWLDDKLHLLDKETLINLTFHIPLVKNDHPIDPSAQMIHRISQAMVDKEGIEFAAAMQQFQNFIDVVLTTTKKSCVLLIAHNNFNFDSLMLMHQCKRMGVQPLQNVKHGDSMHVLMTVLGRARKDCALGKLAKMYIDSSIQQTHTAEDDVALMIRVFEHTTKLIEQRLFFKSLLQDSKNS